MTARPDPLRSGMSGLADPTPGVTPSIDVHPCALRRRWQLASCRASRWRASSRLEHPLDCIAVLASDACLVVQAHGLPDLHPAEGARAASAVGGPPEQVRLEAAHAQAAVPARQQNDLGRVLETHAAIVAEGVALEAFGRPHAEVPVHHGGGGLVVLLPLLGRLPEAGRQARAPLRPQVPAHVVAQVAERVDPVPLARLGLGRVGRAPVEPAARVGADGHGEFREHPAEPAPERPEPPRR
eukprot:CAMPEP_0179270548 /NCGR_PEP_ID=MMETSP0797-20121207/31524_1 /TAXON_ID=47934 /ORGANISM="Dinophysis acuminata, Strain DAEP01" /LENGTH=239 /DNA_ID=CAMNT_0020978887 /DNA_START=15 /DNA_END=730 /DNA_ORIENTATION=+